MDLRRLFVLDSGFRGVIGLPGALVLLVEVGLGGGNDDLEPFLEMAGLELTCLNVDLSNLAGVLTTASIKVTASRNKSLSLRMS